MSEHTEGYCGQHHSFYSLQRDCPGCAAEELADEARCDWCTHYRAGHQSELIANPTGPFCNLGKPLGPCSHYEREPGADDE